MKDVLRAANLEAIRLAPGPAKAHAHLGLTLMREGQLGDAARLAEARPSSWTRLTRPLPNSWATSTSNVRNSAKPCLTTSRRSPCCPNSGTCFIFPWVGRFRKTAVLDKAGEHFQIAHRLQPGSPIVLNYLGGFHEEKGDLGAAETAYRQAARSQSSFSLPLARLASSAARQAA